MPAQVCEVCRSIFPRFWSEDLDGQGFPRGPYVKLQPYRSMEAAAARGCQLCRILLASTDVSFLDDWTLEKIVVTLSRGIMDAHQGLCLAIANDDISHTTFYRVPEPWSDFPPMQIDDPVDNIQLIKTWIQECRETHDICLTNLENFLPTRLLDVGAFKTGEDIRLVALNLDDYSSTNFQPEYVALSHCWGPPELRPITTTKANLKERMARISMSDLSNTFQDAVRTTRQIGERYLWIDSLCIIQDDIDDWAREAALMADVYGNAYCTLAALSSKNSTEGCHVVPKIQESIATFVELDYEDDNYGPYRIRVFQDEPLEWHEQYGDNPFRHRDYGSADAPLRSRAWTLQERELSRRNIHFGRYQLLWECYELKATAQLPWHHKKPQDDFEMWPIRNELDEILAPSGPVASRDRWYELMEDYSFRALTQETDKLPALSGLARYYQDIFSGSKYIAGIWSTHLPAALLWRNVYGTIQKSSTYIAPTWSWASARGRISYESQRLRDSGGVIEDRDEEEPSDVDFGSLHVEKMHAVPRYTDVYGAIKGASLVLGGALLVEIDPAPQVRDFEHDYSRGVKAVLAKDSRTVGLLYPDAVEELQYSGRLFCLHIRGESHATQVAQPSGLYPSGDVRASDLVMGLILEEDLEEANCYRRIGLARWVKRSLFRDCPSSSVTLI
ncbi:heterokaryon incompatibility protein [Phlyctema vagabunda]|uniref:Heterokaryon incompatibility protein n=1 Tax=Phlyctema vagabunda TaxID=108571 RepID=A0ABR4PSS1_9HELO